MTKLTSTLLALIFVIGCGTIRSKTQSDRGPAQTLTDTPMGPLDSPNLSDRVKELCHIVDLAEGASSRSCLKRFNDFHQSNFDQNALPVKWLDIVRISCEIIPLKDDKNMYAQVRQSCLQNAFFMGTSRDYWVRGNICKAISDPEASGNCFKNLIFNLPNSSGRTIR